MKNIRLCFRVNSRAQLWYLTHAFSCMYPLTHLLGFKHCHTKRIVATFGRPTNHFMELGQWDHHHLFQNWEHCYLLMSIDHNIIAQLFSRISNPNMQCTLGLKRDALWVQYSLGLRKDWMPTGRLDLWLHFALLFSNLNMLQDMLGKGFSNLNINKYTKCQVCRH